MDAPPRLAAPVPEFRSERLVWLDGLRAVAALLVAGFHASYGFFPVLDAISQRNFSFGRLGTLLLFVVAGILLPAAVRRRASTGSLLRDRAVRFYSLSTVVILALLALKFGRGEPWTLTPLDLVANLLMIQKYVGAQDLNPVTWTMPMLLFCLALGSALLRWAREKEAKIALSFGASALVAAAVFGIVPFLLGRRLPGALALFGAAFAIGVSLQLAASGAMRRRAAMAAALGLIAAAALSTWVNFTVFPKPPGWDGHSATSVFGPFLGAVAIASALRYGFGTSLFGGAGFLARALAPIGRAGFSLYLTHGFAIIAVPRAVGDVRSLVARIVLAIVIALVIHAAVEKPLAAAVDRIFRRRREATSAPG